MVASEEQGGRIELRSFLLINLLILFKFLTCLQDHEGYLGRMYKMGCIYH